MQPLHRRLTVHLVYRLQLGGAALPTGSDASVVCLSADPGAVEAAGSAVRVLPSGALPAYEDAVQLPGALDLAEAVVAELQARRPALVARLVRLAGSEDVLVYLRRWALRDVGALFALGELVASLGLEPDARVAVERRWPGGPELALVAEMARRSGIALAPEIGDALRRLVFDAAAAPGRSRLRAAAAALRAAASLWAEWLPRVRRAPGLPRRPMLLRTYDEDWGLDRGGQTRLRNLDFVVDGETIGADEVGIWAEPTVPRERDAELAGRGYVVLRQEDVAVRPAEFVSRIVPRLVETSAAILRVALAESWWRSPVRSLVGESLLWGEVARQARPRVFLSYNDLHPVAAARTLALRAAGCLTVQYQYSSSWALDEHGWIPDFVLGFSVVDAMVTWGPLHSEHVRNHRAAIGDCWEVGCLWSEHARLVRDVPALRHRYEQELDRGAGVVVTEFEHVVGVFDSSPMDVLLDHADLVAFYAGVAELARRHPHVLFLCKPKRPTDTLFPRAPRGPEVEAALAAAANVVVLDDLFETAAVIGLCDLSISACYTSTAIETIGAGTPALYYDPTDRFPQAFFRRIPGLVALDEDELAQRVDHLLALDEAGRGADLHARFAALEGHFDGLAVSRLRERLHAVMAGRSG